MIWSDNEWTSKGWQFDVIFTLP